MYKILVVDDEESARKLIKKTLITETFDVYESESGTQALSIIENFDFDLIILDINMKEIGGLEVLRRLREKGNEVPVIILSGRNSDPDKVLGLGIGADDYITKPFSPSVLTARVKSLLRRTKSKNSNSNFIVISPFKFDLKTIKLYKNDIEIDLSSKELKLIKYFMENPYQVFTKEQLFKEVWNDDIVSDSTIMVYIRYLRKKIEENPKNPKYLKTVWGIGYIFSP
jgi:DNA-binding response OmpR family regulator